MKIVNLIVAILVIIGAINWGLVGLFDFNLVSFIFSNALLEKLIYIIVGVAGIWEAVKLCTCCSQCK